MDCKIYVIYDKVAEEYGPLFEAVNDKVAARSYAKVIQGSKPEEYQLVCVGSRFDVHLDAKDDLEPSEAVHDCIISGMSVVPFKPRIIDVVIRQSADKSYSFVEVNE